MAIEYRERTPGQLADDILKLTHRYGELSDELADILRIKDIDWSILRDTVTSDRQADRAWYRTRPGSREREIDLEMKKIQKKISAIKIYLQVKADEARNLY